MIKYEELQKGDVLYLIDPILAHAEGEAQYWTRSKHKGVVFSAWDKEIYIDFTIAGEVFCRPFAKNNATNKMFLSEREMKKLNMTEKKIWNALNKHLEAIDLIENQTEDLIAVKNLIEKNAAKKR